MKKEKYVIIGNGPAGIEAAAYIRNKDKFSDIMIISKDPIPYYKKHKLIDYIVGKISKDALLAKPYTFYKDMNINLRLNQKVINIDPVKKKLLLKHREEINYSKLLIASGGKPSIPEYLEKYRKNIFFYHTMLQAMIVKNRIQDKKKIGIVCGDLINYRVMKVLQKNNYKITLFIEDKSFWPVELKTEDIDYISKKLNKYKNIKTVRGNIKNINLIAKDKFEIVTDNKIKNQVDIFCGSWRLKPELDFLITSGIEFEKGIIVNEYNQTNIKDVWAAGDCAQIYNTDTKDYWNSLGWTNACISGKTAAKNILGIKTRAKIGGKSLYNIEGKIFKTNLWKDLDE